MDLTQTRKGDLSILGEAVLWSFFPIISILSFARLAPIASLAWSSVFLVICFGIIVAARGKSAEIFKPRVWTYIPLITLFITLFYYGLYYSGLKYTTAGNASIIALMELFFSYLLFNVWIGEAFSAKHTVGAVLMMLGALIILFPSHGSSLNRGDFLVFAATACAPVGNYYQQKLRKIISSETIVFLRSLAAIPIFFILSSLLKANPSAADLRKSFWYLAINGILILGVSKFMWMEGIHRISVTKANALSAITPLFTLFFAYFILHQSPTIWQLSALIPLAGGLMLLTS
ncbi:MAG: DMT family transporter [Candidatus Doudnabacteria bacterium]|nr:DMT family transporter [Candidatus Doudnabacteria bacterium]